MFDHEKLQVYHRALDFVELTAQLLEKVPKNLSVHNQLDRASTAIPLNIAEGNGKFKGPDRCRYFDIAKGSAMECAACLDLISRRKLGDEETIQAAKSALHDVVCMLVGLIKRQTTDRVYEDPEDYKISTQSPKDGADFND